MNIEEIIKGQRDFLNTGKTLPVAYRIEALKRLKQVIRDNEDEINKALLSDLGKSSSETFMCETGLTLSEITYLLKKVRRFARPKRVHTTLVHFHAASFEVNNPYGVVLIMSPWNYPFMLTMEPLVGAIAAGNCCVVKPSAYAPATSAVIKKIINECFDEEYVAVVEGGREENKMLLDQKFDYILFTGGSKVGKEVMRRASEHMTPITLELGGKSPCIVDDSAKIKTAAMRIAFGKLLNCGQTCVAPDYFLVDQKIEEELICEIKKAITKMVGENPLDNDQYVHMINQKHYDRVMGLINEDKVVFGGKGNPDTLRIEPTIMRGVTVNDAVMQEEIFGPLLPIITYGEIDEAFEFVKNMPRPLACYLFSEKKETQKRYLNELAFGGGCINDTIIHLATSEMGFGGVGESGMGSYHGMKSLETFSHKKSIVNKYTWMDLPVRYAPYGKAKDFLLNIFLG